MVDGATVFVGSWSDTVRAARDRKLVDVLKFGERSPFAYGPRTRRWQSFSFLPAVQSDTVTEDYRDELADLW